MKKVRAWVNMHLLQLDNIFKANPFSEINVKVQNGVPVDAKKIKDIQKKKDRS